MNLKTKEQVVQIVKNKRYEMKVLFLLFFISTTALAYPNLKVENVSGKFQDNKGSAFAEMAQFDIQ
jgi:hypothetical protein